MPFEFAPLSEKLGPLILIAAAGGVWLGMQLERLVARSRARRWRTAKGREYEAPGRNWTSPPAVEPKTKDAVDQLRVVMTAHFAARPLLNQSEARVFEELCQIVMASNPNWRVMAQVSLGEILSSRDRDAFGCINAKRVDMLLIDERCRPRHAIEYQGGAHHQGTAAARDAVKKEALRRAGIGYHEVVAGQTTPNELRRLVENLMSKAETPES